MCYRCGQLGHYASACKQPAGSSHFTPSKGRFAPSGAPASSNPQKPAAHYARAPMAPPPPGDGDDDEGRDERDGADEEADVTVARSAGSGKASREQAMRELVEREEAIDAEFGFARTTLVDSETGVERSAVDCYFLEEDLTSFKATVPFAPYLYLLLSSDGAATQSALAARAKEVEFELRRSYESCIADVEQVQREDLSLRNHLSGAKRLLLKVSFLTVKQLVSVRAELQPVIERNKQRARSVTKAYEDPYTTAAFASDGSAPVALVSQLSFIEDMREYDVPYHTRACIDMGLRVAHWYEVTWTEGVASLKAQPDLSTRRPQARVLAFDIETTKQPLKFPDPESDSIMMISYMADRQGFLIINREVVSADSDDFEYTPKPEYAGPFHVFNEPDEASLLRRFFSHIKELKPHIYVTFNGDFFDWPFIEARASVHGMPMSKELGVTSAGKKDYYHCRYACHLDCFAWVQRDSYLPHGSHGLKAVTKAKLGYDPIELDPEDMTRLAAEEPQTLTAYSVSDAVATFYLFTQHINTFIFSLCTIIPMNPDEVLRKGSGTLCENLLMVEAFNKSIVFPNKVAQDTKKMHKGHLLDSETYVGGHVESLESGVFRNDIPIKFKIDSKAVDELIASVDDILAFAAHERNADIKTATNADEIKQDVIQKLKALGEVGLSEDGLCRRQEKPMLVHLDVAAMYPNIILTNRLQPCAIVNPEICAACVYNKPDSDCKRAMKWVWRGDYFPINRSEYELLKAQIESETFSVGNKQVSFFELPEKQQMEKFKARIKEYSRRCYKKTHVTEELEKTDTVCMRENDFYVDTVRAFRDRRYTYKDLLKVWKEKSSVAAKSGNTEEKKEAERMLVMYDSMQLAHKCILNSFYGYVMRKGSRWMSMEMAGIVTYTGYQIITKTREWVQRLGRPLELDTDGIWCALPQSFPFNYKLACANGKTIGFSFPCVMLNRIVALGFSNHQYQKLLPSGEYEKNTECSIAFELDGPYRAILLPAAKEKDKKLKKRYAVFNFNGSIAEMKGFELKRRGELKLIKQFQDQVFGRFLDGKTLDECYESVAQVANSWLDVLESRGQAQEDDELLDLVTESSNMSRKLEDYGTQKTCQVTTARRLAEFLGEQVVQNQGLKCAYVVANKPLGASVTERAIPVAIFLAEPATRRRFLIKWTKTPAPDEELTLRALLDWDYYWKRLESCIQKIVTIPSGLQGLQNPVPRVRHPDWLTKQLSAGDDTREQPTLTDLFKRMAAAPLKCPDVEDIVPPNANEPAPMQTSEGAQVCKRPRDEDEDGVEGPVEEQHSGAVDTPKKKKTKKQGTLLAHLVPMTRPKPRTVAGYFQKYEQDIASKPWHIVRMQESGTPGEITLWCLVDSTLQALTVIVPRKYYINYTVPINEQGYKRVSFFPPRSKPILHMYERVVSERVFMSSQKELSEISTDPRAEGVYETKVPLLFRALTELGCVCKVAKNKGANRGKWNIEDLEFVNTSTRPYLESKPRKLFLYHSSCDTRGVIGIYDSTEFKAHVIIANPFPAAQTPNVAKALTDRPHPDAPPGKTLDVAVTRVMSLEEGYKEAVQVLASIQQSFSSSVLVVQTQLSGAELVRVMPVVASFAVVPKPANDGDAKYLAFGWELDSAKRMHGNFLALDKWFGDMVDLAQYSHVPVGNIQEDAAVCVSDLMFARSLEQAHHLLWISESNRPDLGGSEDDDNMLAGEMVNPEVCEPGCYKYICVEFDIAQLALNAIMKAEKIVENEGGAGLFVFSDAVTGAIDEDINKAVSLAKSLDGTVDGSRTFKAMKKLVHQWMADVTDEEECVPRLLLTHLYRWIGCPYSRLREPAVHRVVHSLVKKLFFQLLFELRKLGARVVYANFHKAIVCTGKLEVEDAVGYTKFLVDTLQASQLFAGVLISPRRYWDVLLFVDSHNYGGVTADPHGLSFSDEIVSNWNIAEFLPAYVEKHFVVTVSSLLLRLANMKDMLPLASQAPPTTQQLENAAGDPQKPQTGVVDDEDDEIEAEKLLDTEFTQKLFGLLKDIQKNGAQPASELMQLVSGEDQNYAMLFSNYLCHVLSLHRPLEHSVHRIKKSLFKLIGVKEFGTVAAFKNPCESFTLPDVICSYCNLCRDLDLLRDPDMIRRNWTCPSCNQPIDKSAIEASLVDIVQRLSLTYQVQDLACTKCRSVKAESVVSGCTSCSGGSLYCKEITPSAVVSRLRTFKMIAKYHGFEWLQEVTESLLRQ
eukprot:m51a1_g11953 putative dna polymerase epsilon catalytic subunit a (2223) ;mRNA; r:757795-765860